MVRTIAMTLLAVFIATVAQVLLRSGMQHVGYIGGDRLKRPVQLIGQVASEPRVLLGLLLFVASAAAWLIVLSRVPLSFAYPFAGLTYVLTALFGTYFLNEPVSAMRWLGITLILAGVIVVGRTAVPQPNSPDVSGSSATAAASE